MQLPGMLVEYLINGSCALIWIWGIFELLDINLPSVSGAGLLLLVPGLYVVGMIVDHLAKLILDFLIDTDSFDSTKIILYSPDLGKEYVMRSSRDRIARGAFINTVLITAVFSLSFRSRLGTILPIGIIFSVLCFSMWHRFEASTSEYRRRASEAIEEMLKKDKP
jgi:hypothetical protein